MVKLTKPFYWLIHRSGLSLWIIIFPVLKALSFGLLLKKISTSHCGKTTHSECGYCGLRLLYQRLADVYNISRAHRYQHIILCAILQNEFFDVMKIGYVVT